MGVVGFAGAEMFEMPEGGGDFSRRVGKGGFDSGLQSFGIALGAEVDDELSTVDGCVKILRQLGDVVVADKVDDGDFAS